MPPLPLAPNQPTGTPDWYTIMGNGDQSTAYMGAAGAPQGYFGAPYQQPQSQQGTPGVPGNPGAGSRVVWGQTGPIYFPANTSQDDIDAYLSKQDEYIGQLNELMQGSTGLERDKLKAQIDDAQKNRDASYKTAQLVAQTSRYGTDQQRQTALDQLNENARQFNANHGLEMQKLGLDYANTATQYLSTPDKYFQGQNYINMAGRALGRQAPQYGTNLGGQPTPKTMGDFAVLAGYPQPSTAATSGASGGSATPTGNGMTTTNSTGTPAIQQDPRVNAITGLIKALPPSEEMGYNPNDYAVLNAVHSLYSSGNRLAPGTLKTMSPENKAITESGIARLGGDAKSWEGQLAFQDPGNRAASAA